MNGEHDHRRWRADLPAYLLGSLEDDERTALEQHLEDCEACGEELRWLQPAIDLLPESVAQLDPPPELHERLLAEVRSDAAEVEAPAAGWEARQSPARARPRRSPGLWGFIWRPAAALTAVALVVAVVGGYVLGGGDHGPSTTTTATVAEGGAVHATLERSGDSGTLMLTGLRQARPGHVYQAWVQRDHRIAPSSLFAARGNGTASTAIPHQLNGADTVMVTVEPRGGSEHPTSSPIVTVEMPG